MRSSWLSAVLVFAATQAWAQADRSSALAECTDEAVSAGMQTEEEMSFYVEECVRNRGFYDAGETQEVVEPEIPEAVGVQYDLP